MIRVERVLGLATVQDRGRPGRMHEGLAPGGALVPQLLAIANRCAGNADDVPAIEVLGKLTIGVDRDLIVGTTTMHELRAGDELVVESEPRRVAYLAVRGAIAAPLVLGGRGTQLSAGIGAAIRKGDRFDAAVLAQPTATVGGQTVSTLLAELDLDDPVAVVPGPDTAPGALDALLATTYGRRVQNRTKDRIGRDGHRLRREASLDRQARGDQGAQRAVLCRFRGDRAVRARGPGR